MFIEKLSNSPLVLTMLGWLVFLSSSFLLGMLVNSTSSGVVLIVAIAAVYLLSLVLWVSGVSIGARKLAKNISRLSSFASVVVGGTGVILVIVTFSLSSLMP